MPKEKRNAASETPTALAPRLDLVRLVLTTLVVVLGAATVVAYYAGRAEAGMGLRVDNRPLPAEVPPANFQIVNAHDHLYRERDLPKYLRAAEQTGIVRTLFVASSDFTFKGAEFKPDVGNEWSSREVLKCAQQNPGKIIPFVTMHPNDQNKIPLLEEYIGLGAKGIKLYTGHGNFHDRPFDVPEMQEFYAFCEQKQFPIVWHVNLGKYADDFKGILAKYPKLKVIVPHFGVGFYQPGGDIMQEMGRLLDQYPNLYTDTSFGTRDILVQGLERVSGNPEPFRGFYEKYQDRIVWGTDMVITGNKEKTTPWIASCIRACRDMHEKDDYTFWMAADGSQYSTGKNIYGRLRGLKLAESILRKIYETNIQKILGEV